LLRSAEELLTGIGHGQAARRAVQQPCAQMIFQGRYMPGDGGVRRVQLGGGGDQTARLHHSHIDLHRPDQIHRCIVPLTVTISLIYRHLSRPSS